MTYDRALQILNLSKGFSEEELKKSYRKNARIWHPDVNKSPQADSMFKEIHEAYEILKNTQPGFSNSNGIGLVMAKMQIINEMNSYLNGLYKINNNELRNAINTYIREVKVLIKHYEGLVQVGTSLSQVTRYYEEFKINVKSKLDILRDAFIEKNPYFRNVQVDYNYDLDAYHFVLSLEKLKKETEDKITERITNSVISRYSLYTGYDEVKGEINYCVAECIDNILKGNAMDQEIILLGRKIEDVFKNTFDKSSKRNELKKLLDLLDGLDSLKLRQRVDKLIENIDSEDFYDELDFLMFQAKSIKTDTYVDAIRLHLNDRFRMCSISCKSQEERDELLKIYNDAIRLLDRVSEGLIGFDIVSELFDVKFEDVSKDRELIDFVCNKTNKVNTGYVYVAKNTISTFGYLYLQEDSYQMKYRSYMGVNKLEVNTRTDIVEDFVSLSMFLANAQFIGKRMITRSGASVDILYELDGRALALTSKGNIFIVDMDNMLVGNNKVRTELNVYRDKQKVLEKIIDKVDSDLFKKSKR